MADWIKRYVFLFDAQARSFCANADTRVFFSALFGRDLSKVSSSRGRFAGKTMLTRLSSSSSENTLLYPLFPTIPRKAVHTPQCNRRFPERPVRVEIDQREQACVFFSTYNTSRNGGNCRRTTERPVEEWMRAGRGITVSRSLMIMMRV